MALLESKIAELNCFSFWQTLCLFCRAAALVRTESVRRQARGRPGDRGGDLGERGAFVSIETFAGIFSPRAARCAMSIRIFSVDGSERKLNNRKIEKALVCLLLLSICISGPRGEGCIDAYFHNEII